MGRKDGAVCIAVERHAEFGARSTGFLRHFLWMKRATLQINVATIRTGIQDASFKSQASQHLGRYTGSRTVSAIDYQPVMRASLARGSNPDQKIHIVVKELRDR